MPHSPHPGRPNRLVHQTSPYLLQHAHNPVDWYPWGAQALETARRENRPILLSIGYSACHWCHVMAHESFEDEATAAVMNARFVNIKVDREERPDLDKIYQEAHRLMLGRGGGWPLTMFLTPQQVPFFGGTYFPPEPRHGLPAFRELLIRVADFHDRHPERIDDQGQAVLQALAQTLPEPGEKVGRLDETPFQRALTQLEASFDAANGGFGQAPKFPHATALEFLLRQPTTTAREMAFRTLRAMADGGIHDHLGGGFFRYAVDERWTIPHFEKMLYDNGALLALYADAWRLTGEGDFRGVAEAIGEWVLGQMQSPEGGYYSTLDADGEEVEGGYYLWEREAVEAHLTHDAHQVFALRFGLDQHPNFEGRWHLHVTCPTAGIGHVLGLGEERVRELLQQAREQLLALRQQRTPPGRDEKILTAWNALMIRAMARAGRHFGRDDFIQSAERAFDFLRARLWREGRLSAAYKDGQATAPGYLDDYAFLLDATLELLQTRWRDGDLRFAIEVADTLLTHFEDEAQGGFFFTADDHESLIHRPKPFADESLPSGNGVAAQALLRLGHLVGDLHYLDAAERTVRAAWAELGELAYAHASLLLALESLLHPPQTVVLRGPSPQLLSWRQASERMFSLRRSVYAIPSQALDLPGILSQRKADHDVVAFVCHGHECAAPTHSLEAFQELLHE